MANNKKESTATNSKAHFNVIDAVVILLVIAIGLGIFFRARIVDKLWAESKMGDYVISFSIEDIRYSTPTYMNVGDEVYFADGELLGELISESDNVNALNITPAAKYFADNNGNMVEVFYPDSESRVDVKGKIQCQGYYDEDGGFSIDGRHYIAPSQNIDVKTELVSVSINIMSIEPLTE